MTLPNLITVFRIILIPLFVIFLLSPGVESQYLAAALFGVLALSDAADGWIARKFNQISDFGRFTDPLADKILVMTALVGLVETGAVSAIPVIIIMAREFLVMGLRVYNEVPVSFSGKSKTTLQLLAIFMLILNLPLAGWILWLAVLITVWSGAEYFYHGRSRNQAG